MRRRWLRRAAKLARDGATLANAKVDLARYQTLAAAERHLGPAACHPAGGRDVA